MMKKEPFDREDELEDRARLLLPVTLANTNDEELDVLLRLLDLTRRLKPGATRMVPKTRKRLTEEREHLLGELEPLFEGKDAELPFNAPRRKRQGRKHYVPWRSRLAHHLRRMMATATEINGKPITAELLDLERQALRDILDKIVECNALAKRTRGKRRRAALVDEIQDAIIDRLVEDQRLQFLDVAVDDELDRLVVSTDLHPADLGTTNTRCLVRLLESYAFSSVGRCKLASCGRIFFPAADGRKRTKGVLFCTDSCKREETNSRPSR